MDFYFKLPGFSLARTLFCGQAFRWKQLDDVTFFGIVDGKALKVRQESKGITLTPAEDRDISFWEYYFDIHTDYDELIKQFSQNEILRKACEYASGIRVLRQPPFETLISFIISQNNNIKRISGIIERLCENFGNKIERGYTFPSADVLAKISEDGLSPLRAGFRARYIIDAAKKVADGEVNLDRLFNFDADIIKKELIKITGVGDKVADCVLLFAYGKTEAVPKDVWIKRALARFFPDGLPECVGEYGGIAQQFLFEYVRNI
ncbi:MAG: DNA-3-methyladenine glycosylase 2 [Eubacterium sp.]|jgi:N-glycosylase/DNA lyase|nr:DNA-3-methyladenine glycosylase 2 [Eubacterium sp.]